MKATAVGLGNLLVYSQTGQRRDVLLRSNMTDHLLTDLGNDTEQMAYLNKMWSKWMPENSPKVAVDSHPRLSGIMDTINASDAHGSATKLPSEFYDKKAREIAGEVAVDEWFAGYKESNEYRKLGIGGLMGDVVDRMVSAAVDGGWRSATTAVGSNDEGKAIKFALSGCHDTTLASILGSLGAYDNGKWPPFTSSIAIELFSKSHPSDSPDAGTILEEFSNPAIRKPRHNGFLSYLLGSSKPASTQPSDQTAKPPSETARMPLSSFPDSARETMKSHYVRIRYNDTPVRIPGCAANRENHLPGDETFCTLDAFKEIVDKFTPADWREECVGNLGQGLFGKNGVERIQAGY